MSERSETSGSLSPVSRFMKELALAKTNGHLEAFLIERSKGLEMATVPIRITGQDRMTYNFIHPASVIRHRPFSKGFHLDDPRIYQKLSDRLQEESPVNPDRSVLEAVQLATLDYFGTVRAESGQRDKFLGGLIFGRRRSVRDLQERGLAMCAERAAVSHNLCHFAGLQSLFLYGSAAFDQKEEGHAFQILVLDGSLTIFDATNPSFYLDVNQTTPQLSLFPLERPVEFIAGAMPQVGEISHRYGAQRDDKKFNLSYRFNPAFPASFDDFSRSSISQLEHYATLSQEDYRLLAIQDALVQLGGFAELVSQQ